MWPGLLLARKHERPERSRGRGRTAQPS